MAAAGSKLSIPLEDVIQLLQHVAKTKTYQAKVLLESDIIYLCCKAKTIFQKQPILLELEGPLKVCGDIHGQFQDLIRLFDLCGSPHLTNYLFLGDYVDRGRQSLETICLLFAFKIKYPDTFFLLRGNHESLAISRMYGFFDECKRRYNISLWKTFLDVFNWLPVAAIIENQIFCCHGGLSPDFLQPAVSDLSLLKELILSIRRPFDVPEKGIVCDLLWSDPMEPEALALSEDAPRHSFDATGFAPNERGVSYVFSPFVVDEFLTRFGLDLVVRAHQVVEDGYEFFSGKSFVTIFSAPNYCGEFDNAGGIFCLNRNKSGPNTTGEVELAGSFQILYPDMGKKAKAKKRAKIVE